MPHRRRFDSPGFTLLEVIVFLAVASIGIGITLPMLGAGPRGELVDDAKEHMEAIQHAIVNFFEDNEEFPASLDDLVTKPGGAAQWLGPYVQVSFSDLESGGAGWKKDPWRQTIQLVTVSATVRKLRSYGPDRTNDSGGDDDIDVLVDANAVMWKITKREMLIINNAITHYNATEPPPQLNGQYTACLNVLQAKRYLPIGAPPKFEYRYDAWGQWYRTVGNPVTKIRSLGPP